MAISVKFFRQSSAATANKFLVTAASADTGKLQIQYNSEDIYNNLSGATNDIVAGATNTDIYIPLDENGNIPKGVYYFNFVASAGTSATATINFLFDMRSPVLTSTVDVYAPSFLVTDQTNYASTGATISALSRTETLYYPEGSAQPNVSATSSSTTEPIYISTTNVWSGAMQTVLTYDITYSIASTTIGFTTYSAFTYQEQGEGYDSENVDGDTLLSDVYNCIETLRRQVVAAETKQRSNYEFLLQKYTYACSLALQYREAVTNNKTEALNDIIAEIKNLTDCNTPSSNNPSTASHKIYGINGIIEVAATWGSITGTLSAQSDLQSALDGKQATLVSGTNIKTINSTSLLGSGNIDIVGSKPIVTYASGAEELVVGQVNTCIYSTNSSFVLAILGSNDTAIPVGSEILLIANGGAGVTITSDGTTTLNGSLNATVTVTQYKPTLIKKVANTTYVAG